jgi:hypothetical protein
MAGLVSTMISIGARGDLPAQQGFGTQLGHWGVLRAILLNLAAVGIRAVFGLDSVLWAAASFGATVTATVLDLVLRPRRESLGSHAAAVGRQVRMARLHNSHGSDRADTCVETVIGVARTAGDPASITCRRRGCAG